MEQSEVQKAFDDFVEFLDEEGRKMYRNLRLHSFCKSLVVASLPMMVMGVAIAAASAFHGLIFYLAVVLMCAASRRAMVHLSQSIDGQITELKVRYREQPFRITSSEAIYLHGDWYWELKLDSGIKCCLHGPAVKQPAIDSLLRIGIGSFLKVQESHRSQVQIWLPDAKRHLHCEAIFQVAEDVDPVAYLERYGHKEYNEIDGAIYGGLRRAVQQKVRGRTEVTARELEGTRIAIENGFYEATLRGVSLRYSTSRAAVFPGR